MFFLQMPKGTSQAIEPPDDEGIPFSKVGEYVPRARITSEPAR
jgi:hypothetical protein